MVDVRLASKYAFAVRTYMMTVEKSPTVCTYPNEWHELFGRVHAKSNVSWN